MGEIGKLIGAKRGPHQFTTKAQASDLVSMPIEDLYALTTDQLLDLAQHVVLAPGVAITPEIDKRQLICRLIQSAVEIQK